MNMNSIRRRNLLAVIYARAGQKDGAIAQFSRETGISEGRLAQVLSENYRDGKNFGEKAARNIEEQAGLPAMSLDKIDESLDESHVKLSTVSSGKPEFDSNVTPAAAGTRAIPVISAIQAGALKEITEPYAPGDGRATIYVDDSYSKWAFALEIEGESMLPDYRPGDVVIIEPDMEPRPGDCVVAKNGREEATFKKYRQRGIDDLGNPIFELVPLNNDYPTIRSDTTPLVIIGVMVEFRRKTRGR